MQKDEWVGVESEGREAVFEQAIVLPGARASRGLDF